MRPLHEKCFLPIAGNGVVDELRVIPWKTTPSQQQSTGSCRPYFACGSVIGWAPNLESPQVKTSVG